MRVHNQPDAESNHNPNFNPNPVTEQHAVVSIQLNIVACSMYLDKFIRYNVIAPLLLLAVVTVPQTKIRSKNC